VRRDLGVVQVLMVAAAGADELKHVGVTVFEAAVHDPGRLASHERRPAVAGLTGKRRCNGAVGGMRSHGSARSCGRGGGTSAGRAAGPVPVMVSGVPGLLTRLTARR